MAGLRPSWGAISMHFSLGRYIRPHELIPWYFVGQFHNHEMQEDDQGNFTFAEDPDGNAAIPRTKNDDLSPNAQSSVRVCSAEDIDVDVDAREHISGNAIEMVNNPSKKPWMSVKEKTDEEMGPFSFSDHDSISDEDDSISDASGSTHLESAGSEDALVSEEEVKNKKTEGVQIQALKACINCKHGTILTFHTSLQVL